MNNANGSDSTSPAMSSGEPPLARRTVASAMEAAMSPAAAGAAQASGQGQQRAANVTPLAPGEAHKPARNSPYHAHGSVLEGGDSPAVLAQPAAATASGQGSQYHPVHPAPRRAREMLANAQDAMASRYRQAKEGTDDFVHDNPWKAIGLAAVGGLIVGLLAAR